MLATLILVVGAVLGGTSASYLYDDDSALPTRLAYGVATGFAALAGIGFVVANLAGLQAGTLVAGTVVVLPFLAALIDAGWRDRLVADVEATGRALAAAVRRPSLGTAGPLVYAVAIAVFIWFMFSKVVILRDGTLSTGYVNNLGDLPFHLQVTASFAFGQNFPPEDPTYAGTGFAYPYLSDLLAAMFVRAGAPMSDAFLVENVALGLALVGLLHRFTRVLTADRLASYMAPILVLLSGGIGWVVLIQDARNTGGGLFGLLGALTHDYTIGMDGYRFGNAITTLLVTQRSLLFGLPIALIVFILLWKLINLDLTQPGRIGPTRIALAAGILTGSLPLIHAHSFVVVMGTAFLLGLVFRQWREGRWRPWAVYVIGALVLALPQIWWSTHDSIANAGTFFGFEFGWDHGTENIAWFWFLNTGILIPLAVVAARWPARPRGPSRSLLLFTAVFATWFVVPNVMKLAPWIWDNIKVLFYWYVGSIPIVALLIARLLKSGRALKAAGAAAFIALTLAGGLDVWRVASGQTAYQEFDRDGIAISDIILAQTPARALVLHAPTYNPPVFLTGRRSLLGYTGYIWAHGLPYVDREADIKRIYAGDPTATKLIAQYGIDYILVSPIERNYMPVNDAFFGGFTKVGEAGEYTLYEVARP